MKNHRFSRRAFAKATGLSLGFLPLLSTDRKGWAQSAAAPKRLVTMSWPNGVRASHWWPDSTGTNYTYDASKGVTPTNFSFKGLRMSEPLEPHRSDLLFFQGIGVNASSGHESLPKLFNLGNGNTLDQHVAATLGAKTKFRSLSLGAQKRDRRGFVFRNGQGVTLENDPYKVFASLFSSGGIDPKLFEQQRASRKSVLDYVGKQLEGFGKTLGTDDRELVGFHLQNFREVEKRLTATDAQPTGERPASLPPNQFNVLDTRNFHRVMRAQMDLMALAFASDLTRVASMACSDGDAFHLLMPWLGPEFEPAATSGGLGNNNNHHANSHKTTERHSTMQRWFAQQFADFIQTLKNTPSAGGGRVFDSTIVFVVNIMATGGGHRVTDLPTFIAAGGNMFKTGRYLKRKTDIRELHVSVANALGAPLGGAEYPGLRG